MTHRNLVLITCRFLKPVLENDPLIMTIQDDEGDVNVPEVKQEQDITSFKPNPEILNYLKSM